MLKKNASVLTGRGHTATFRLAFNLWSQQVGELFDIGVNVNHKNKDGRTVLHTACEQGLVDIAEFVLSRAASSNMSCD